MTTSGTYVYDPSLVDIVLDAFERIQIYPSAITNDHMLSARRSLNLINVRWSNRGINLWAVDLQTVTLNPGQSVYTTPLGTVSMLDTYVRQYTMGAVSSETVDLSITSGSNILTIGWPSHGLQAGWWISVSIYLSVGGLIVQGFYPVRSVPDADSITIELDADATSTVANGGAVPEYTSASGTETVTVTLADHGFLPGEYFTVHVQTEVGGLSLLGEFLITTTPTANTLTFSAGYEAGSTETVAENDDEAQYSGQSSNSSYTDRILSQISRTDYANIPNKANEGGYPTVFWFDRTTPIPTFTLWQVPQLQLPMELRYYRMRQLQDANPQGSETADMPYRFLEAYISEIAYHLAIKWKPAAAESLLTYAKEVWSEAAGEDREKVTWNLVPDTSAYWR